MNKRNVQCKNMRKKSSIMMEWSNQMESCNTHVPYSVSLTDSTEDFFLSIVSWKVTDFKCNLLSEKLVLQNYKTIIKRISLYIFTMR